MFRKFDVVSVINTEISYKKAAIQKIDLKLLFSQVWAYFLTAIYSYSWLEIFLGVNFDKKINV